MNEKNGYMQNIMDIAPEVADALETNKPVVACESTIISHGMPYPENLRTAREVEKIIRDNNAVPATIAIIEGRIKIGLSPEELEFFSTGKNIAKASRRDLPVIITRKQNAATTVATTMICADLAGIRVFATGGIGGVHRNGWKTFDISADLQELSHTDVAVVSAGAKSILDLDLTLEYLETFGVPVLGYKTEEFPAFYCRSSGRKLYYKTESPWEIAEIMYNKWSMKLNGGLVIANPVDTEHSMDFNEMEKNILKALDDAKINGVTGKEITPFLLSKIKEQTHGKSLETNIALVYNNAGLAARIAESYWKLINENR